MSIPCAETVVAMFLPSENKAELHKEISDYMAGKGNIQDVSGASYRRKQ